MRRVLLLSGVVLAAAGCGGRSQAPAPAEPEVTSPAEPACGKVFRDPTVRGGSACCEGPSATAVGRTEVLAACGRHEAEYLGQTRDGATCRYHFAIAGTPPREASVVINRPVIPPGAPAPVAPDPNLPWKWKKLETVSVGQGFQATETPNVPEMSSARVTVWGARLRRVVGIHASRAVCDEGRTAALLQKVLETDF